MKPLDWIARKVGTETFELLSERLSGSELKSLLLEVVRRRATARQPSEVLEQYARDAFCRPAVLDQRLGVAIDSELLTAAEGFEALELAPLAPLAATTVFGRSDQNRVVSTTRGSEVVSDPTNLLALECAERLRRSPAPIHLTTSQRVVRAQPFPKRPGHGPHFRLFALASAGFEQQNHDFVVATLVRHVRTLLSGLSRFERLGYRFGAQRLELLATRERAAEADRIAEALTLPAERGLLEHPYYSGGLRFRLSVSLPNGAELSLADGGTFDWVARLTSNRRAVYVASGLGAQLLPLFRTAA